MEDETLRKGDVRISGGKILDTGETLVTKKNDKVAHFDNHYLYRGLINSHDHLEMNLYSRMGTPPYQNYTEWARDIYKPNDSPVKEIESIPIKYRLLWGGIKNLISGVTTVVHHNPWRYSLGHYFPVNVLKK
jgi:cytosine/adenosine deaminase-related metal-dependent hydrolase